MLSSHAPKSASRVSPGIIAGAGRGGIALMAAAVTAYIRIRRRSRRRRNGEHLPDGPLLQKWQPDTVEIPQARNPTVLALDRAISPGVMESQEAMLLKAARLRRDIRSAGFQSADGPRGADRAAARSDGAAGGHGGTGADARSSRARRLSAELYVCRVDGLNLGQPNGFLGFYRRELINSPS
jgi:hypothetical protein